MRCFKHRILRPIAIFLPMILMVFVSLSGAQAQIRSTDRVGAQLKSCHKVCFTEGEKCVAQPGSQEPFCNTLEIGCVSSCAVCIGGYAICVKNEDISQSTCQNAFDDCLDKKLTATRSLARTEIAFKGGDGLSKETAIVIEGAMGEFEGIMAENLWVVRHHPDWRKRDQALIASDGKHFDMINYDAPDGRHAIWYDVTGFLGK